MVAVGQSADVKAWSPNKGDTASYSMMISGTQNGTPFTAESVAIQTVSSSAITGFTLMREVKDSVFRFGGQEIRDMRTEVTEIVFDGNGKIKEVKDANRDEVLRLVRAVTFVPPAKKYQVGDLWKVEYPAVGKIPTMELSVTGSAVDPVMANNALRLTYEFKESGDKAWSGKGSWVVDRLTGQMLETNVEIMNWLGEGQKGTFTSKLVVE